MAKQSDQFLRAAFEKFTRRLFRMQRPLPSQHSEEVELLTQLFNIETGQSVGVKRQQVKATWSRPAAASGYYEVLSHIPVAPGRYELRVGFRGEDGRTSSVCASVARPRLLVLLVAWAVAVGGAAPQEGRALRVMTWNIAAGHGDLSKTADVIRQADADVVALQEVDAHWDLRSLFADQPAELAKALDMHVRFGPIYQLPGESGSALREFGVAILSRHPIVEFRNHLLPRLSTQSAVTEPELMPGFPEAVLDVDGARVRVFNTHLDYRADPRVRHLQVAATMARLDAVSGPIVLMGDLNAPPDAAELVPLFGRLRDAWPAGPDAGFTYPANVPVRRIDYILTSPDLRARNVRVLPIDASDHRPVVADLMGVREN